LRPHKYSSIIKWVIVHYRNAVDRGWWGDSSGRVPQTSILGEGEKAVDINAHDL
jgi:hypothetical protein